MAKVGKGSKRTDADVGEETKVKEPVAEPAPTKRSLSKIGHVPNHDGTHCLRCGERL